MDGVEESEVIEIKDNDKEEEETKNEPEDISDEDQSTEDVLKETAIDVEFVKEPSIVVKSGPNDDVHTPDIVDITDDTSNSSNATDVLISKPIVTEPEDVPPPDTDSTSKSTPEIIEITDPTGDNFEVEFIESTEETAKENNKEGDSKLEKIHEEVDSDTEKVETPTTIDTDTLKSDQVVVENQSLPQDSDALETSFNNIENEIAALEKSGEEKIQDVLDEQPAGPVNGVDLPSAETSITETKEPMQKNQESLTKEHLTKIPSHLIGRDLEKPVDTVKNGRVAVTPRLGVKVPYRNLMSQIVSKQEITDEIMERSRQRQALAEPTGNVLFAKKLTSRLARKLSPSNKTSQSSTEQQTPTVVATAAVPPPSSDRIANNSDLIALLEGDDDSDWNLITTKKSSPVKNTDWERETALKQLQDLPKLTKKEVDEEPRFSINPVTKTYTRKRKPSEDIKAILEAAKKPALTPHSTRPTPSTTPAKAGTVTSKPVVSQKSGETPQKAVSKTLLTSKPKSSDQKPVDKTPLLHKPKDAHGQKPISSSTPVQKLKPIEHKGTPTTNQKDVTKLQGTTPSQKSILGQKQVTAGQKVTVTSPKTPNQKLSIQKSIQNIRNLSAQSSPTLPPHAKLSTDKKAIIILSTTPEDENKNSPTKRSNNTNEKTTPIAKKPLSPNTYISKSLRVVKRKKIWDPDEVPTPNKIIKSPRAIESSPSLSSPVAALSENQATVSEQKVEKQVAKKFIKRAMIAKKKKPKRLTEIDRLLMDEGAVNLLYAVKNTEPVKRKTKSFFNIDKAERDLLNRTNEIKNDLLQINKVTTETPIALRKKAVGAKATAFKDPAAVILQRKKSKDSTEGSVQLNTPPASPAYAFHENVSRIIRRHSSSSFTSKESDDDEHTSGNTSPVRKKKIEKQRKNSISASVIENNVAKEVVVDDSKYSKFETFNVRKFDNLVQIILVPTSPNALITLTLEALNELIEILDILEIDTECRVVLVSSAGSSFCLGIDYKELAVSNPKERKTIAKQYATAVRAFLLSLSTFSKIIVAGVHGNAIGLGVTMLPLFDMVLASDTATFSTPYTRLGCTAEGGALLKLPHIMHNALAGELFFASRKLTAAEALRLGLVTRTLWPDKFQEELISALKIISGQSLQSMQAIKKQLRHELLTNVEASLKSETGVLIQHWISNECQGNFESYSFESK